MVAATGRFWLPGVGTYLEVRDDVAPADVLVVLAGNAPERMRHALQLYREGYAPQLLVSNERVSTHGMETTWLALYRAGLSAAELPAEALIVLDDPIPESTLDEARRAAELLRERGLSSAILVTDTFHSRRSAMMFGAEFRRQGLRVVSSPADEGRLELDRWWEHPETALVVAEEYAKLLAYVPWGVYW